MKRNAMKLSGVEVEIIRIQNVPITDAYGAILSWKTGL